MRYEPDEFDEDADHIEALSGGDWAFIGACVTIAVVGLVALIGSFA